MECTGMDWNELEWVGVDWNGIEVKGRIIMDWN
jgi:hypothetical protein